MSCAFVRNPWSRHHFGPVDPIIFINSALGKYFVDFLWEFINWAGSGRIGPRDLPIY